MDCPHCHSKFNSASSLNKNIKSAKYCNAKKQIQNIIVYVEKIYRC